MIGLIANRTVTTKQFAPMLDQPKTVDNPKYARIYVIRPSSLGDAENIIIGGGPAKIGNLGSENYLCWERLAG